MLKTRFRIFFIQDFWQSYALAVLQISDKVSGWLNKSWPKFHKTTAASVSKMMWAGEENLDFGSQEGSKDFRHSVSKIYCKARVYLGRNLERSLSKRRNFLLEEFVEFRTEKTQM